MIDIGWHSLELELFKDFIAKIVVERNLELPFKTKIICFRIFLS